MALNASARKGRACYDEALRASHREAWATLAAALVTALFFWGAVLFLDDRPETIFSLPLWFVVSCIGGYLFSVAAVWILVKCVFKDIALDEAAEGFKEGEGDAK